MKKILLIVALVAIVGVGGFFVLNSYIYSEKQDSDTEAAVESNSQVSEIPTTKSTDLSPAPAQSADASSEIEIKVVNSSIALGDAITVTWDVTRIPQNAKGIAFHIVRPDHNYVSGTGVVGVDPKAGTVTLQSLPSSPFPGYVEGDDYYISAMVTNTSDPNGDVLIQAKSEAFRISAE